jgi:hypothetical protein
VISIGNQHPILQKPAPRLHPDNEVIKGALKLLERKEVETKDRIFELHPNSSQLEYNVMSIGSAKSTLTTSILEGYKCNDAKYLTRDPSIYLKWELLVDERKLPVMSKRYLEGKEWVRTNHVVIIRRGSYGIIIEGSHGIGTRGLELLVDNEDRLLDLKMKNKKMKQ